ncbi:MAG TPA: dehydrogenase, partial [Planctomycetaceae bacterium]|nr:dehydrogenase [Planctomycetaceae bacterium]
MTVLDSACRSITGRGTLLLAALGIAIATWPAIERAASAEELALKPGDTVCYVGNGLADRMQHDGYLETLIQSYFPKHQLVFRNLGYTGDEVTLRLRSKGFGSPDEHLTRCRATVVFAFFGYNESFQGKEGLDKFIKDLADFVQHTQGQKYDGKTPCRVVLFSPIAHEDLGDPNLPDGSVNNRRLEMYTNAMRELASVLDVPFVDLFHPTLERYAADPKPLTINGVHLNEHGNRFVAQVIGRALFPERPPMNDAGWKVREPLRQAVLDKNFHWFQRYRTVDGYSIYGGRADLKFYNGQTNRVVMDREMEVLDVMTANRDRAIWAVAQGRSPTVDDSNTPPFLKVITNKPGPLPGGKYPFLGGEEAIEKMTVAEGMKVQLFASEEMFPELVNPVQMAFDTRGRMWVAVWPTYPHWKPKTPMNDKILIFEDTDGDGRADKCTTFADGLHVPTGLEFYNGGVLVGQVPDLMF